MRSEPSIALQAAHEELVRRPNRPAGEYNDILQRWENPVLTRAHVPPLWRYDFDARSNPRCLERLGVNAVFNSGAVFMDGLYYLVARVEGADRKSFFALATSESPTEGFAFQYPIELPDTQPEEVNVYDMRLTRHEDGWIYGLFCSESKEPSNPDPSAALAACGIARTKDFRKWERLPNLKAASQQRNVALFPAFINGHYAFLTRPQDGFTEAGSGGGICYAACQDIENAEIVDEILVSPRRYHQITEAKNGAGAPPIRTEKGWLHIAHGVRGTAAGLRYVLYAFVTDLRAPWRVIAEPAGYLLAPLGGERVGDVSNVVFCNGAAVDEAGRAAIYYASSDTRLHVATTDIDTLLDYAFHTPADPGRSAGSVRQRAELIRRNEALLEWERWLENVPADDPWRGELEAMAADESRRTDAFYKDLAFGTGGLRAVIGAGSNRMNHYTVGRATQGLANYLKKEYPGAQLKACVAYDTRRCSAQFARHAANVLSANGAQVYLFAQARPTPMLSFAVRQFGAHAGIVITASHNEKEYNGYKAYNATGGQLTDEASKAVLEEINQLDVFQVGGDRGQEAGRITLLDGSFDEIYFAETEKWLPRRALAKTCGGELNILYSPLHGTGLVPVTGLLARLGYSRVTVVASQREQDEGRTFPTVKKPNPEEHAVFGPAIELARALRPDITFATDPDADRIGVLTQNGAGDYVVLTGNQVGALLCEYLIRTREEQGSMPPHPAIVTTIVTGTLAEQICRAHGVHVELVLTGFKYIGERMDQWKASGERSFLFGFEESYGCLAGDACRDKDAVLASALIAEMALYYKQKGMTLYGALMELYDTYGPVSEDILNVDAKGAAGTAQIASWMSEIRKRCADCLPGETATVMEDYASLERRDLRTGEVTKIHLPASEVVKLTLADGSWLVLRPSGTEPKIKLYVCTDKAFAPGVPLEDARARCAQLIEKAKKWLA